MYHYLYVFPLSPIPYLPSSALEEILDRPIEIYSSDAEELVPMKIDFDSAAVSQPLTKNCINHTVVFTACSRPTSLSLIHDLIRGTTVSD